MAPRKKARGKTQPAGAAADPAPPPTPVSTRTTRSRARASKMQADQNLDQTLQDTDYSTADEATSSSRSIPATISPTKVSVRKTRSSRGGARSGKISVEIADEKPAVTEAVDEEKQEEPSMSTEDSTESSERLEDRLDVDDASSVHSEELGDVDSELVSRSAAETSMESSDGVSERLVDNPSTVTYAENVNTLPNQSDQNVTLVDSSSPPTQDESPADVSLDEDGEYYSASDDMVLADIATRSNGLVLGEEIQEKDGGSRPKAVIDANISVINSDELEEVDNYESGTSERPIDVVVHGGDLEEVEECGGSSEPANPAMEMEEPHSDNALNSVNDESQGYIDYSDELLAVNCSAPCQRMPLPDDPLRSVSHSAPTYEDYPITDVFVEQEQFLSQDLEEEDHEERDSIFADQIDNIGAEEECADASSFRYQQEMDEREIGMASESATYCHFKMPLPQMSAPPILESDSYDRDDEEMCSSASREVQIRIADRMSGPVENGIPESPMPLAESPFVDVVNCSFLSAATSVDQRQTGDEGDDVIVGAQQSEFAGEGELLTENGCPATESAVNEDVIVEAQQPEYFGDGDLFTENGCPATEFVVNENESAEVIAEPTDQDQEVDDHAVVVEEVQKGSPTEESTTVVMNADEDYNSVDMDMGGSSDEEQEAEPMDQSGTTRNYQQGRILMPDTSIPPPGYGSYVSPVNRENIQARLHSELDRLRSEIAKKRSLPSALVSPPTNTPAAEPQAQPSSSSASVRTRSSRWDRKPEDASKENLSLASDSVTVAESKPELSEKCPLAANMCQTPSTSMTSPKIVETAVVEPLSRPSSAAPPPTQKKGGGFAISINIPQSWKPTPLRPVNVQEPGEEEDVHTTSTFSPVTSLTPTERPVETPEPVEIETRKREEEASKPEPVPQEVAVPVKLPPFPVYEGIDTLIYLDDKVTKYGKKVKRTVETALFCDCKRNGWTCSDNRCINREMMYECSSACGPNCNNQRFTLRQYPRLRTFYTGPNKGWGVRAEEDIKKDTFIIEYVGEVVTLEEFCSRAIKYSKDPKHTHHYIFELGQKVIDATVKGNCSRFVNHSCEPNAICLKWAVPKTPRDVSRIGFFAKQDIQAGEEITFDYQFCNYGRKAQTCYCGTESCKGVIGQARQSESDDESAGDDEDEAEAEEEMDAEDLLESEARRRERDEWLEERALLQLHKIITAGPMAHRDVNKKASRFVKQLAYVSETDDKLRMLSFIEHSDSHFYESLKRHSIFDVFCSWLNSSDWSRHGMELKYGTLKMIATKDNFLEKGKGWKSDSFQSVVELASLSVPDDVIARDVVDGILEDVCDEDDDSLDSDGMSHEQLFARIVDTASRLANDDDVKKGVAADGLKGDFRIPKKQVVVKPVRASAGRDVRRSSVEERDRSSRRRSGSPHSHHERVGKERRSSPGYRDYHRGGDSRDRRHHRYSNHNNGRYDRGDDGRNHHRWGHKRDQRDQISPLRSSAHKRKHHHDRDSRDSRDKSRDSSSRDWRVHSNISERLVDKERDRHHKRIKVETLPTVKIEAEPATSAVVPISADVAAAAVEQSRRKSRFDRTSPPPRSTLETAVDLKPLPLPPSDEMSAAMAVLGSPSKMDHHDSADSTAPPPPPPAHPVNTERGTVTADAHPQSTKNLNAPANLSKFSKWRRKTVQPFHHENSISDMGTIVIPPPQQQPHMADYMTMGMPPAACYGYGPMPNAYAAAAAMGMYMPDGSLVPPPMMGMVPPPMMPPPPPSHPPPPPPSSTSPPKHDPLESIETVRKLTDAQIREHRDKCLRQLTMLDEVVKEREEEERRLAAEKEAAAIAAAAAAAEKAKMDEVARVAKEKEEAVAAAAVAESAFTTALAAAVASRALSRSPAPPPPPPPRRVPTYARATDASGDVYYFHKETRATTWELPPGETADDEIIPYGGTQPDSSADVCEQEDPAADEVTQMELDPVIARIDEVFGGGDEAMVQSESLMPQEMAAVTHPDDDVMDGSYTAAEEADRPASQAHSSHMNGVGGTTDEQQYSAPASTVLSSSSPNVMLVMSEEERLARTKSFKYQLEREVKPIIFNFLKYMPSVDADKKVWLVKQIAKEMFKRESGRLDFDMILTSAIKKKVHQYTTSFMRRKMGEGESSLWKGYERSVL